MNSRIFADYIVLKRSLLFFIVAISTTFVSLSEKSDACRCDNSQGETSFSEIVPQNIFFSDCCFDLSDILPVHHILDTDKNPLASKRTSHTFVSITTPVLIPHIHQFVTSYT